MSLDPRTLAFDFILTISVLGVLLVFFWAHNRSIRALGWWSATFCLNALGIGMANLLTIIPVHPRLILGNALVALAYAALYTGCRVFNGRQFSAGAIIAGPLIWLLAYPLFHDNLGGRITVISLITGGYAALSAYELAMHARHRLSSQRFAVALLVVLTAFNLLRAVVGLPIRSMFGVEALANRWSSEMALFLNVYAPALAFVLVGMVKQHIELGYRKALADLRESEEHYRYSVQLSPQIPWTADPQGNVVNVPRRWQTLTGQTSKEAEGFGWTKAIHPDDLPAMHQKWLHSMATGVPFIGEYRVGQTGGGYRWFRGHAVARLDESGAIFRWYGTSEDIHDRKVAQEQLLWAAYHDDLTGLANRRRFSKRLQEVLHSAADGQLGVGLLIMDLDHLKLINDRFGHDAGDSVLQEFAKRLVATVPEADTIARLGGDEFAVVLTGISGEEELATIARAILHRMRHPLPEDNAAFDCRTSIGAAFSLAGQTTAKNLQKQADLALYRCKATGRGAFRMFHAAMSEESQKEASALDLAGRAVASDWVVPFYQPKVSLVSGVVAGFEALLRLEHPHMGIQYPDTISPAFEDTELGTALGQRMRASVFRDIRNWLDAGVSFGRVAINVSAAEFRHDDYAERVLEDLKSWGLPTHCLEIEVTESVFLGRHVDNVERALRTLSAAGVTIALDDFGTGYASLTHLKRFRVDAIKIDRSFVRDIETDAGDAAIVKALLSLGQSLRIAVVAEGVETEAQTAFLRKNGCDLVQGYYYGRPAPGREVLEGMAGLVRA